MRLHVVERGPEETDVPDAPPVVLLHGLFGRARNMGFFQRRLCARRRVLAVDLRNHGDSPHGIADYPVMAADLLQTLRALHALPAVLAGHSMGGKAAMTLALLHPESVSRLLVADMPPAPTGHGNALLAERLLGLELPPRLDRAAAEALLATAIDSAEVRHLMMQNLRLGENGGWSIGLPEIVRSMPSIEGWPASLDRLRFDGPTLFVAGARSPYLGPRHEPAMRRLFPNHTLQVIEDAGHWVHAEQPNRFLELLEAFASA